MSQKNLIGHRIERNADRGTVTLSLVSPDTGRSRNAEAGTYRIAADIAEMSLGEWAIDVHATPGLLGKGRLGTYIVLETMTGTAAEMDRAELTIKAALDA